MAIEREFLQIKKGPIWYEVVVKFSPSLRAGMLIYSMDGAFVQLKTFLGINFPVKRSAAQGRESIPYAQQRCINVENRWKH